MASSNRKHDEKAPNREQVLLNLPEQVTKLAEAESDRGAILILGAYLDEILGLLIAASCVTDALADGILKHGQPAGSFEERVQLAQALGLIHEEDVKGLRIIQKIRNKAAHFDRTGRGFDVLFDSPTTIDQVVELSMLFYEKLSDRSPAAVRRSFIDSARGTATRLLLRRSDIKRPNAPQSTQELVSEALGLEAKDSPFSDFIARIRQIKDSTEGQAQYQAVVHMMSRLLVNSIKSPDGVGLPAEMLPAVAELLSQAGTLDLDSLAPARPPSEA